MNRKIRILAWGLGLAAFLLAGRATAGSEAQDSRRQSSFPHPNQWARIYGPGGSWNGGNLANPAALQHGPRIIYPPHFRPRGITVWHYGASGSGNDRGFGYVDHWNGGPVLLQGQTAAPGPPAQTAARYARWQAQRREQEITASFQAEGQRLFAAGKYPAASSAFARALRRARDDPELRLALARALIGEGKFALAGQEIAAARRRLPPGGPWPACPPVNAPGWARQVAALESSLGGAGAPLARLALGYALGGLGREEEGRRILAGLPANW